MTNPKRFGATRAAVAKAAERDAQIEVLIEQHGRLTAPQITRLSGFSRRSVDTAIARLRANGAIRDSGEKDVWRNHKATFYEIGGEQRESARTIPEIHRHPQDVALFGEYQRAA